tara:strand:+ start:9 stop:188 length:180 start_codon:yes stop_codon:yes gene_type:complete
VQVGDLVKYHTIMRDETLYTELGIILKEADEEGVVIVKWPDYPPQHELEFALERVNGNR